MTKSTSLTLFAFAIIFISLCASSNLQSHENSEDVMRSKRDRIKNVYNIDKRHQILLHFHHVNIDLRALEKAYRRYKNDLHTNVTKKSLSNATEILPLHENETTLVVTDLPITENSSSTYTCDLPMIKVLKLDESISDDLTRHDLANDINCDVNVSNSEGACHELIKVMQCGISELHNIFEKGVNTSKEFTNAVQKYDYVLKNYQFFIDHNKDSFTSENISQLTELIRKMQDLQNVKYKLNKDLHDDVLEAIHGHIVDRKPREAAKEFIEAYGNAYDVNYLIDNAVEQNFSPEYFELFEDFLTLLPVQSFTMRGFEKLFYKMKEFRRMYKKRILIFYDTIMQGYANVTGFDDFRGNLTEMFNNAIKEIANGIRSKKSCTDLEAFTRESKHLEDVLNEIYQNVSDVEFLLDCLPIMSFENSVTILINLYKRMISRNEIDTPSIFVLASNVMSVMEKDDFNFLSSLDRVHIDNLKRTLPASIRGIIWNKNNCTLKNVGNKEYLYASEDCDNDNLRRKVYTMTAFTNASLWKFEPLNSTKLFQISNRKFLNQYFYAYLQTDDVLAWIPGEDKNDIQGQWIIEPNKNGNLFNLRNNYRQKYLHGSLNVNATQKSLVKTGDVDLKVKELFDWEIDCI